MKKRGIIIALASACAVGAGAVGIVYFQRGGTAMTFNQTQLSIGEKYLSELNYEQAVAQLENVISSEPNNAKAYISLAQAYDYMGDIDTAAQKLRQGYEQTQSPVIQMKLDELINSRDAASDIVSDSDTPEGTQSGDVTFIQVGGLKYRSDSKELVLREQGLTNDDLANLSQFKQLESLDISGNAVTDLGAVAGITGLKKLYAANNEITDISPLSALGGLEYLGLRNNKISDASALFSMPNLKYLHLADNEISSVSAVGAGLKLLYLENNRLTDVKALAQAELLYCDVVDS